MNQRHAEGTRQPSLERYVQVGAGLWLLVLVLWSSQVLRAGASVLFLLALSSAAVFVGAKFFEVKGAGDPFGAAGRGIVLVLLAAMPVVFDPQTGDAFNIPRYTLLVVSALVLLGVALGAWACGHPGRPWRNGLDWPVLALVGWTAVATATSLNPRVSLLGEYHSYDGLYAAIAFAVVFFAVARTFRFDQVKVALAVLYFAGGGLCVLYGFIQLADRTWGTSWDWLPWGRSESFFAGTSIWSTLGNPNHLAGFLAVLLPIGIVLFVLHHRWWVRCLVAVIQGALVLELLQTTTRGAWLAALASLAVVALMSLSEVARRPRAALSVCGAVAAVVVVAAVSLGSPSSLSRQLGSVLDFEGKSSAAQRVELWKSGVHMANDRPLVGMGPDVYASTFQKYKTPRLIRLFGVTVEVNGPHNVFVNHLAGLGYPGLALFTSVLAFAALRSIGAWRRIRRLESTAPEPERPRARDVRLVLTAVTAALVAYLVQASFNVQQIGLTFISWALLGLLCVLAVDAGVPTTLRPRLLVAAETDGDPGLPLAGSDVPTKSHGARSRLTLAPQNPVPQGPVGASVAIAGTLVLSVLAVMATAPYRAERRLFEWSALRAASSGLQQTDRQQALRLANAGWNKLEHATRLNPWEPTYLTPLAGGRAGVAARLPRSSPQQLDAFRDAGLLYEKAIRLDPRDSDVLQNYAKVMLMLSSLEITEAGRNEARGKARSALERAVLANPFDTKLTERLKEMRSQK